LLHNPLSHRNEVAADAQDPTVEYISEHGGDLDLSSADEARLLIEYTDGTPVAPSLVLRPFWKWNDPEPKFYAGEALPEITEVGAFVVSIPALGPRLFVKIETLDGTTPRCNIRVVPVFKRP
jgi:hypothetical protein